jgi:hypothetical protein
MARELKLLNLGTISIDGTKLNANANIHKSIRYDRARELRRQLEIEVQELMKKAETADGSGDGHLGCTTARSLVRYLRGAA